MTDGDDVRESDSAEDEIEVHLTLRLRLTDWKALRAQARRQVTEDTGPRDTEDREERLDDVDSGPFGALAELIDPDVLVAGIRGVEPLGALIAVGPPGDIEDEPDFAELFPLDETVDGESDGWLLSPRTASALYGRLLMLGDYARDELEELGDAPITSEAEAGMVFSVLPGLTWRQDAVWRDRFIGAIDALISDLAGGEWPQPRCPAEEMALHLALQAAEGVLADEPELVEQHVVGLPAHARDYDWEGCRDVFFEDEDILMLYDARLDGVEDPEAEVNRELRIGDYRPAAWFDIFGSMEPRER